MQYVSASEAVRQLGITPYQLNRLVAQGRIQSQVLPGLTWPRFATTAIATLKAELAKQPTESAP